MEQKLTERPMVDIDGSLLEFLGTQVDSLIKWDLIHFFLKNPNALDTAENIARYTGRSAEDVRAGMAELSSGSILTEHELNGMTAYSMSREPEARELLHRFEESCDDQQFRLKAIYHVLRNMR